MPQSPDGRRIYSFYHYLVSCLAIARTGNGEPNSSQTGQRLGNKDKFRKQSSLLFKGEAVWFDESNNALRPASITTGTAVEMLAHLSRSLRNDYQSYEEAYTRVLSLSDVLTALHKLVELTPEERRSLGLPSGDGLTLLQQALLILQVVDGLENYEMLFRIYKAAVGLDFNQSETALVNLTEVDALIESTVDQALGYLPHRPDPRPDPRSDSRNANRNANASVLSPQAKSKEKTRLELTQKAQREIRRLLVRSGNQKSQMVGDAIVNSYIRQYLQPAFVTKLAQTVVANERLTDQFPVYLKRIALKPSGPLPFADRELGILQPDGPYPSLLHPALRRLDRPTNGLDLPGPQDYELASQEANRVTAEFYIKVPQGYQPRVPRVFQQLASEDHQRIDFALQSTGIGGALSHLVKVINRALLMDLPCLKDYFPIAHDVTSTQVIIRDNVASPVWAHSLVKLCQKQTMGQTLRACRDDVLQFYETFSFADPFGRGDYCGFDFLLSQAQAALQARLQAIRSAGVAPHDYLTHLCQRVEYSISLQNAWSYLEGYPFSSLAMLGVINQEIFEPNQLDRLRLDRDDRRALTLEDPYIYFDAYLSIAEAFLDEGAYRIARRSLRAIEILETVIYQSSSSLDAAANDVERDFKPFSGELTVRYLLCKAHYFYLYDPDEGDPRYLPMGCDPQIPLNSEGLARRAWDTLKQAQRQVWLRLRKYVVINEVSQGTFHPHYSLLARIAFLRMKLLLFCSPFIPREELTLLPTENFAAGKRTAASIHWGRLYLAEKARLYAAAEGDSEVYACYAATQSWLYLMAAHAAQASPGQQLRLREGQQTENETLNSDQCLSWAKTLRDHALVSYASSGRDYYYQIKEKSGLLGQTDSFGPYKIQKFPAIYETRGDTSQFLANNGSHKDFLVLDMSLLAIDFNIVPKLSSNHPDRNIYLFGTNACYLFFARGMYMLCAQDWQEFGGSATSFRDAALADAEVPELSDRWQQKLNTSLQLLHMARALASDGGSLEIRREADERSLYITRNFAGPAQAELSPSLENAQVRDLYPRRVSEIVDLSQIFAAATLILQRRLLGEDEGERLSREISTLLDSFHSPADLSNPTFRAILARQKRYNGHLSSHLTQAKAVLIRHLDEALNTAATDLRRERDRLLADLFGTVMR